ncbi:hypothetical protein PR048_004516 [Dryococelus australis]|uniref:Uncharacterized protein n=1 Tax=Dryococelus australis TaxID=614101 RepID=A0ABQ9I6F2_9NEOP|nr:hypothetical protein PR048_004516 [Dryococelus australis]
MRRIAHISRYVPTIPIHRELGLETIQDYMVKQAQAFYQTTADHPNPLIRVLCQYDIEDKWRYNRPSDVDTTHSVYHRTTFQDTQGMKKVCRHRKVYTSCVQAIQYTGATDPASHGAASVTTGFSDIKELPPIPGSSTSQRH